MPTPASGFSAGSTASTSSSTSASSHLSDEVRAGALWTFIQAQAPRFTFDEALEVVRSLRITPREDHKALAKRLRKALQERRIALKHVNALHAAAQLCGHTSWHDSANVSGARLRLEAFVGNGANLRSSEFGSWDELAPALRAWADQLHASGQLPLGVLAVHFKGQRLNFLAPAPRPEGAEGAGRNEMWPLGMVSPVGDDGNWLAGAPAALEKLRRHIEEAGKAVLDGYAVLSLCARSGSRPGDILEVGVQDVANSELVLLREDNEDDPHSGYEIARGDELTCWHQLELSLRSGGKERTPTILDVAVPREGSGAWYVNGGRYVWAVETLKPQEFLPGREFRLIGPDDCERLLRRYKLAKRIHQNGFRHHDFTKQVDYLGEPSKTWRVDLHRLLHILNRANLTWDSYIERFSAERVPMQPVLPAGFVMKMLDDLNVEDPNKVFAWPTLAEMELVVNDRLLCSLMPRVESVRYAKPDDLNSDEEASLRAAVQTFAEALGMQKMVELGSLQMEEELPYLVYASDAQELCGAAEELGLRMYLAVAPHLTSTKGLLPDMPGVKMWQWAFGHAVLLRFERMGAKP